MSYEVACAGRRDRSNDVKGGLTSGLNFYRHAGKRCGQDDQIRALRIAARFFDRSTDTKTFKRGIDAYNNSGFYRQLGKDPEQLMAAALEVLAKRFGL